MEGGGGGRGEGIGWGRGREVGDDRDDKRWRRRSLTKAGRPSVSQTAKASGTSNR